MKQKKARKVLFNTVSPVRKITLATGEGLNMCQSLAEGGMRCPSTALAVWAKAEASGDEDLTRQAKFEYYMTSTGVKSLRDHGKDDLANKLEARRERIMRRNKREWRQKNNITVAFDLDNTTVDFTNSFRACLAKKYSMTKQEAFARYPTPKDYEMKEWFRDREEFLGEFKEAEEKGLYENMQLFRNARREIRKLQSEGYRIHFVTARTQPFNENTKTALRRYKIPYHVLKHMENKEEHTADIFFDDAPKQIKTLSLNGKNVVIFDRDYNREESASGRVSSWEQVNEVVDKRANSIASDPQHY